MLYKLQSETLKAKGIERTYINEKTGTEVKTSLIYTDKEGGKWFGFNDLYKIPYIRIAYSKHISDLFTIGLTLKDIISWCDQEKSLIRGNDPEKYEKLYSLILEKERLASHTADPMKMHIALATVYVLREDERIDYFDDQLAGEKIQYWNSDTEMLAFFLTWHNRHIQHYIKDLSKASQIVSKMENPKLQRGL